jgi:3-oxoacyl-[acyl-carrier-protein] synthase II
VTPQTGHLMAGAGALNAAVAALAVHAQVAPPTVNLDSRDPECVVDLVSDEPREMAIAGALALSMGLEGQATSLLFTAHS